MKMRGLCNSTGGIKKGLKNQGREIKGNNLLIVAWVEVCQLRKMGHGVVSRGSSIYIGF